MGRKEKKHFCSKRCWYDFLKNNNGYNRKRKKSKPTKKKVKDLYHSLRQCKLFKDWREKVFKRDDYKCRVCGVNGFLEPHHIITVKEIAKEFNIKNIIDVYTNVELFDVDNGITLCKSCHIKTFKKENLYVGFFNNILNGNYVWNEKSIFAEYENVIRRKV